MDARDSSGRRVSLLNEDLVAHGRDSHRHHSSHHSSHHSHSHGHDHHHRLSYRAASHIIAQPYRGDSPGNAPELFRSDSYDSNTSSSDAISPQTPTLAFDYSRASAAGRHRPHAQAHPGYDSYEGYEGYDEFDPLPAPGSKRPSFADTHLSESYEDDNSSATSPLPSGGSGERPGKRYPCRYRDSHGCEKTFTTSGHASRHSKIHTAEKAVQCTFAGCQKKFTRADNMKQHLETHYKDKSRSIPSSHRGSSSSSSRKSSSSSSSSGGGHHESSSKSGSSSRRSARDAEAAWEAEYGSLASPGANGAWDLRGLNLPLMSRPSAARIASSGLDALAMAVACQEGV